MCTTVLSVSGGTLDDMMKHMMVEHLRYATPNNFLDNCSVKPHMRQRLADWLLEVSEAFQCCKETFSTTMTLFDRYVINNPNLPLEKIQLVGSTILFMVSKLLCVQAIHVPTLCSLADNCFTAEEVMETELVVLEALKWTLEVLHPHDYLEHMLHNLPLPLSKAECDKLRQNSEVFIDLCYTEASLMQYGPAVVAAASLFSVACGETGRRNISCEINGNLKENMLGLLDYFNAKDQELLKMCAREALELFLSYAVIDPNINSKNTTNATTTNNNDGIDTGCPSSPLPVDEQDQQHHAVSKQNSSHYNAKVTNPSPQTVSEAVFEFV